MPLLENKTKNDEKLQSLDLILVTPCTPSRTSMHDLISTVSLGFPRGQVCC